MGIEGDWPAELAAKSQALEKKALDTFGKLTPNQLNWRPDRDTWSIAQQFDHLVLSNRPYLGILEKLGKSAGPATKPYQTGFWGKLMLKAVSPEESIPAPVPKPLIPTNDPLDQRVIEEFMNLQDKFHGLVASLMGKDLNAKFASPFAGFVKLKLGDALHMNALHNERHLNKAFRLLERPDFPSVS